MIDESIKPRIIPTHLKNGKPNPNHPKYAEHMAAYKAAKPKVSKAKFVNPITQQHLDTAIGNSYPDTDPYDHLARKFPSLHHQQGKTGSKLMDLMHKASPGGDFHKYHDRVTAEYDANKKYDHNMKESKMSQIKENIELMVDQLMNQQKIEAAETFNMVMMQKLNSALENMKVDVASQLIGQSEVKEDVDQFRHPNDDEYQYASNHVKSIKADLQKVGVNKNTGHIVIRYSKNGVAKSKTLDPVGDFKEDVDQLDEDNKDSEYGTIKLGGKDHPLNRIPIEHYNEFREKHPGKVVRFRGPRHGTAHTKKEDATHFYAV